MEKLELKHLAPYLPYKLKVKYGDKTIVMNTGDGSSTHWIGISAVLKRQTAPVRPIPVLRPLSDLTKEIKHNGEKFIPVYRLEDNAVLQHWWQGINSFGVGPNAHFNLVMLLFEWHFDVFGLINAGLAIEK